MIYDYTGTRVGIFDFSVCDEEGETILHANGKTYIAYNFGNRGEVHEIGFSE